MISFFRFLGIRCQFGCFDFSCFLMIRLISFSFIKPLFGYQIVFVDFCTIIEVFCISSNCIYWFIWHFLQHPSYEVEDFLRREIEKEKIETPGNFEEKAIAMIGRPLYEAFIKEYTMKQWHKDPRQLPESILSRLPFRTNYNESYYFDRWQGVPLNGYTEIFQNMLKNERITLQLNTDYFAMKDRIPESTTVIYSGPIDKFFDYKYGRLEWLTLDFEKEIVNVEDYQGTSVMNYAERSVPYTRIHEPRHLHPERTYSRDKTMIIKEYSVKKGENNPYYPITDSRNTEILSCYLQEKKKTNVVIGGRLGDYKYYDMDRTIETALSVYKDVIRTAS
ncbi:MAG: UDP-galactopyranose mutase [Candidatus Electrothrix sp. AX5]|nr:UDP-galactopyranose mutase [Candidatus Electrothrix sp. AX5]